MEKDTILIISFILILIGFLEIVVTRKNKYFFEGTLISLVGVLLFVFLSVGVNIQLDFNQKFKTDIETNIIKVVQDNFYDNKYIEYEGKKMIRDYMEKYKDISLVNLNLECTNNEGEEDIKNISIDSQFKWYFLKFSTNKIRTTINMVRN